MPWDHSPSARAREGKTYQDPEYQRNRKVALRRAGGTCKQCSHKHTQLEVDHINGTTGGHGLGNLQVLCRGPGTCDCHGRKTSQQGTAARKAQRADPTPAPRTRW